MKLYGYKRVKMGKREFSLPDPYPYPLAKCVPDPYPYPRVRVYLWVRVYPQGRLVSTLESHVDVTCTRDDNLTRMFDQHT